VRSSVARVATQLGYLENAVKGRIIQLTIVLGYILYLYLPSLLQTSTCYSLQPLVS